MQLETFENNIADEILARGRSYFSKGYVTDLQELDDNEWIAIVEGNDDYEVSIWLGSNNEVLDYACDCPFEGAVCKHVVAVLFRIREEKRFATPSKKAKENDWKQILASVPHSELMDFLIRYAAKNKDFRNELTISFTDYDQTDNPDKYLKMIDGIFETAADRHGYIDYHHVYGAMNQVSGLLVKADQYVNRKIYKEAFFIAAAVATRCIKAMQGIDDSGGECGGTIHEAFTIVSTIVNSNTDEALQNEIADWVFAQAANPEYRDYGCDDELLPLLLKITDSPERVTRVLTFIDEQLKKTSAQKDWSSQYRKRELLDLKMKIFNKTGQEEKAEDIIRENMQIHEFRMIVVERYINGNKYDEAITLVKQGIDIATKENYPGTVTNWKEKLVDIYTLQNNTENLRAVTKELYFGGHYDMKDYRKYKATFGKMEWKPELEKIIHHLKKQGNRSHLANIYIEEAMWAELLGFLQTAPNMHSLLSYSSHLVNDYAKELIPLYRKAIEAAAQNASDRSMYQTIGGYLLKMAEIHGGRDEAIRLKSELLTIFNRRPAMKDELNKLKKL